MDRIKWEEKKRRNAELERKVRRCFVLRDEENKPGAVVEMPSGSRYEVMANGSWKKVEA